MHDDTNEYLFIKTCRII